MHYVSEAQHKPTNVCVCVSVDMYNSYCGDITLYTQSHCGDPLSLWGRNASQTNKLTWSRSKYD